MRRSVLAEADGIVGQNVNGGYLGDRSQAHRRTHVVGEVEKRAAKRPYFYHRHAIQGCTHGMFADSEVKVAPTIIFGTENACAFEFEVSLIRGRKIGRSANQPRNILRDHIQYLA